MKFTLGVVALAAASVGVASAESYKQDTNSYCTCECKVIGDPHVYNFAGQTQTLSDTNFGPEIDIYIDGDFSITGTVSGNFLSGFTFGSQTITSDECTKAGQAWALSQKVSDSQTITADVSCFYPSLSKYAHELHLQAYIYKTDFGGETGAVASFDSLETKDKTSGLCVTLPAPEEQKTPNCTCGSTCALVADPKLTDFFGNYISVDSPSGTNLTLYYDQGFKVIGRIGDYYRVEVLEFGNKETYVATELCHNIPPTETFANEVSIGSNGDTLSVNISCMWSENEKEKGQDPFFDVYLTKNDRTNDPAASFKTMEASEGSSGLCIDDVSR